MTKEPEEEPIILTTRRVIQFFEEGSGDYIIQFVDLSTNIYFLMRNPGGSLQRMNNAIRSFCGHADYFLNDEEGFGLGFVSIPEIEFCRNIEILSND